MKIVKCNLQTFTIRRAVSVELATTSTAMNSTPGGVKHSTPPAICGKPCDVLESASCSGYSSCNSAAYRSRLNPSDIDASPVSTASCFR